MSWAKTLRSLLNLVLEVNCPLCHRSTPDKLCHNCQRQIQRCQLSNTSEFWRSSLPLFAWGRHSGALRRAIASLKYDNQPQLAHPLGHWLAQAWLTSPLSVKRQLIVVPIPMHADKQKQRGFNQAELMARAFCDVTGLTLQPTGLSRIRATEPQFSLSPAEREQNLAGAIQVGESLHRCPHSKAVLLLDDIYTTGATARAAVHVLQQQQISVYGLVVLAKASGFDAKGGRQILL